MRRLCSRLGILAVVVAAAIVIRSLYNIQIIHGAEYRQYAAQQQLLDTTIKATRGEIYDASGITLASTSVVWTIWADPSYSSILYTSKTNDDDTVTKTLDPAMCAEVSRELTLRLLSGDGESLDSVDTSSAEYQQQYQTVYDALSRLDSAYVTLATKVNNAVKLSIEKYVTSFNKAHKKATDTSRKGRISVSSEKASSATTPTVPLPQRCWALRMRTASAPTDWKILPVHLGRCGWPHHHPAQRGGQRHCRRQRHHLCRQGRLQSGAVAGCERAGDRGAVPERSHCSQYGRKPRLRHCDGRQDRRYPCHGFQAGL